MLRDRAHAELLADFITKLKATKEADGSSLYDHMTLTFGSNIRVAHSMDNAPTLVAGGGAGMVHGRNMVLEKATPLCNLWLSMLQGSGIQTSAFGDSNDSIHALFNS